nr:putative elongation Factor G-like domain containing protein [Marseillevirus cajuinensis]
MYICLISRGGGKVFVAKFQGPLDELKKRLGEREILLVSSKHKQKNIDGALLRIFEAFYARNYQRISEFEFLVQNSEEAAQEFREAVDGVRESAHIKRAMDAIDKDLGRLEEKKKSLRQKRKILKEELESLPCQKNSL